MLVKSQCRTVHPIVRKLATATCLVSLLPISMGALVTTLKAGMAFADWPSSDGQNMLLYPWFRDFSANPDKFVEHGHRLAGMLIGLVSVVLAVAGWKLERGWVKLFVSAILFSVVAQGLLGGARVMFDRQLLAMIHSITGAFFFSLCVVFRLLCSSRWPKWISVPDDRLSPGAAALVCVSSIAVTGQYVLGGMLRHLHLMLNEHLFGAAVAGVFSGGAALVLIRSTQPLLRLAGVSILGALCVQLMLGLGSYVTRFGLPLIGYVATVGSVSQAVVCSLHTVGGMLLLASTVVGCVCVFQLFQAGCLTALNILVPASPMSGTRGNAT